VWETLEPLAQRQNLSISYSGPEKLLIKADSAKIYQVFLNLFDNSIKYSSPNTSIKIQAEILSFKKNHEDNSDPAMLEINLIDAGEGFADEDLLHVFERFYRGDIVGNGLGLAIVRQIILAHGGSIKAMNHPQTGGAWIQIHIPEVVAN
jgi:two-component system phosphate regulon sensor histidine kinase PhoR